MNSSSSDLMSYCSLEKKKKTKFTESVGAVLEHKQCTIFPTDSLSYFLSHLNIISSFIIYYFFNNYTSFNIFLFNTLIIIIEKKIWRMNSSSLDLMSYCSLAKKKKKKPSLPNLREHCWSINNAQFLQILANIPGYRYFWRCS